MTEQYNREQKIVEIKERQELRSGHYWQMKQDIHFLLSEIDRLHNCNDGLQARYNVRCERIKELELSIKLLKDEKMANIQELTIQHQREVDRLQQEYADERASHNAHMEELLRIQQERDKAIEGLRWVHEECERLSAEAYSNHEATKDRYALGSSVGIGFIGDKIKRQLEGL